MATDTRKGMMLREQPADDREKYLAPASLFRHEPPERRETTLEDDFVNSPLFPNPDVEATTLTNRPIVTDRLQRLMEELYQQDPHCADQLSNARTQQEFLSTVCRLFNLSRALTFSHISSRGRTGLSDAIAHFMTRNLHKGPSLKTLAQFLGYSEKYCSELFRSIMGESFSRYLKRRRTERAVTMLRTTDKSVAEIASVLGFSDQFAFSHFFKRSTGQYPRDFRTTRTRRRPFRTRLQPPQKTRWFPLD
jgi:AraC-like DNA-binding protein